MERRSFLTAAAAATLAPTLASFAQDKKRPPRIVLRSSWQTVNIGDIGHTPGVLTLLEKYLPEAEVRLWPSSIDNGVDALLKQRFPKLTVAKSKDEVAKAFEECDFLLHGSGASFVAQKDVARWHAETKKPFGIFGITHSPTVSDIGKELMSAAKFIFFRDTVSLAGVKQAGVTSPIMEFGPDGAFAVDLRNDAAADKYLKAHDLQPGKFMCCIPRLRYTPYWLIKKDRAFDQVKHDRNEEMKDHDHAPLRDAITALVRETDMKVLLCPEDMTHMAVGKEQIFDKLPAEVKKRVVWREDYWLTDEALSTYLKSAGLFGNEMHSPIMCIGNGVPAIVCRFDEQTSKGLMWRDIGLGDWLFNHDHDEAHKGLAAAVVEMAKNPAAAKEKAAKARAFVEERQRRMMDVLKETLA